MASYGYGSLGDRAFVGFDHELEEGDWKKVVTRKYDDAARESVIGLLAAPKPVVWKIRLRMGIAGVLVALGATSLVTLDADWDSTQRRLFHGIGAAADDPDPKVRAAAERLRPQLLGGSGTAQTQLDYDGEVDFGRKQVALALDKGPLAADAKTAGLEPVLRDVKRTTEALAEGLGRSTGGKRRTPSKQLREALTECAGIFNGVHDEIAWFARKAPNGPDRDHLTALLAPLEALLERSTPVKDAPTDTAAAPPVAPPAAPNGSSPV